MKRCILWLVVAGIASGLCLLPACEWGSGGDTGFNTSQGAGAQVNFSGVYKGMLNGGVIDQTSGGPIGQLVIQQAGNSVEVTDDHGSVYRGTVGSPGAVSEAVSGTYPAGAQLVQAQINFTGHDNVADKTINFAGVIHAVAVTDIKGTTTTDTSTDSSKSDETVTDNITWTTNVTVGSTSTEIVTTIHTIGYDSKGNKVFESTETTTTTPGGTVIAHNRTVTDNRTDTTSSSSSSTTTDTTTYNLTEANTQYRMQGTWVEEGGKVANLDAISSGTAGVITTTSSSSSSSTTTSQ